MMNNYTKIISCYAADTAGVCSALFELGGMTIVHDASGCNSTYATHDEPRWFNSSSMIYISALTEMDMVCGNDNKLIDDVVRSAQLLQPEFIALCNSPIPFMVGTDMQAVAREIMEETSLKVKNIRYYSSQPWPFPNSLMLGFIAEYDSGEIQTDGEELEAAGWFNTENLPLLPDHGSIARRIIEDFKANRL